MKAAYFGPGPMGQGNWTGKVFNSTEEVMINVKQLLRDTLDCEGHPIIVTEDGKVFGIVIEKVVLEEITEVMNKPENKEELEEIKEQINWEK